MTAITKVDAKDHFWNEIGTADKFKPQHAKFMEFLDSHETVTFESVMECINGLINELTPNDNQPRRALKTQPGA